MDFSIFHFINGLAGKFRLLDWLGIFLAEYFGYFLVLLFLILLLKEKNWRSRIYFFSLTALSLILSRGIITEFIRFIFPRQRPFEVLGIQPLISHPAGGSLPSGHAAFYFALALAVFYMSASGGRKWGWRFLIAALIMGIARIFVGVHWPLDIVVGAAVGLGSAFVVRRLLPIGLTNSPRTNETEIENAPVE